MEVRLVLSRSISTVIIPDFDLNYRALVDLIYVPPQLDCSPVALLPSFQYDYRTLYINQPRVRLDGVYIAACHCQSRMFTTISMLIYLRRCKEGTQRECVGQREFFSDSSSGS
jgi:hypothetical protein